MTRQVSATHKTLSGNPRFLVDERLEHDFFLMLLAMQDLRLRCESILTKHEMGMQQLQIMDIVRRHPSFTMKDLMAILHLDKPALFRLVRPMIDRQWMMKFEDGQDRRRKHLKLTADGDDVYGRIMETIRPIVAQVYRQNGLDQVSGFESVMSGFMSASSRNLFPEASDQQHLTKGTP